MTTSRHGGDGTSGGGSRGGPERAPGAPPDAKEGGAAEREWLREIEGRKEGEAPQQLTEAAGKKETKRRKRKKGGQQGRMGRRQLKAFRATRDAADE